MKEETLFYSWKEGKGMDYMDSWLAQSSYGAVCGLWTCFDFQVHLLSQPPLSDAAESCQSILAFSL